MGGIDKEFFDLELYSIYKAMTEVFGEESWKVVWRMGEIMLSDLEEDMNLSKTDPFLRLQKLADYLKRVGYAETIEFHKINDTEIEFRMANVATTKGMSRLLDNGDVPAHTSTSLFSAALSKIGLKMEMIGKPTIFEDGSGFERWKIIPK